VQSLPLQGTSPAAEEKANGTINNKAISKTIDFVFILISSQ